MNLNRRQALSAGLGLAAATAAGMAQAPSLAASMTIGVDVQDGVIYSSFSTERLADGRVYAVLREYLIVPGKGLIDLHRDRCWLIMDARTAELCSDAKSVKALA